MDWQLSNQGNAPLRIAIVSTPRSGNTWLRRLLASTYMLEERAAHSPENVNWEELPASCILQIHWHRTESFLTLLARHRFRVVALARHPLDVLISILHFAPHEPETARWLEGEGGSENEIIDVSPRSSSFLAYATGPRAAALLSISHEWWRAPGSYQVRYEDLVTDPLTELDRLGQLIGYAAPNTKITEAVAANSLAKLRAASRNQHFWRGMPGHWRNFLPAVEAHRITQAHESLFKELNYECNPDHNLDNNSADRNWTEHH